MAADDVLFRVRDLITAFKEQAGATGTSPVEVCGHVARSLGVSEATAAKLVLEAGLRGGNPAASPVDKDGER